MDQAFQVPATRCLLRSLFPPTPASPSRRFAMATAWSPSSWRGLEALQMAEWEDKALAQKVMDKLGRLPPLVQPCEADRLKSLLAAAARGERFLIQGGDCAERFVDCEGERLEKQVTTLLQIGMIMEHLGGKPALCIARIAGQYGKPRSKPTEVVEGYGEIMSFKGDNINGFSPAERKWDPERLLQGYFHAAATLNFLRGFVKSADPMRLASISISQLKASSEFDSLKQRAQEIEAKYASEAPTEFFTAHEAMQLDLEEALTRKVGEKHYNLSAHLVWIGDRTRQIKGAHVEYFRGISNPIGVKVGPSMKNDELQELVKILNPDKEEGRLVIITRYGASKIEDLLPGHIEAVKAAGVPVVWQCDAVHGNGIVAKSNNYKTRKMDDIVDEIVKCIGVHKRCGTVLAGIHLEMTGQETVTECLGGCIGITEDMLSTNYETYCDPRLNYAQSIETAFKVGAEAAKA
uniref:Phospho-2-dehydro-3-deoxyheptonate aldolase n=1 Tax=Alexandrium monilatum TaxID=311494 RepID=A0A7S4UUU4_9DINO